MSANVEIKKDTHLVIKKDFLIALTDEEREQFANLVDKIFIKCGNHRRYHVINEDEEYFPAVMKAILDGEAKKIMDRKSERTYPDPT